MTFPQEGSLLRIFVGERDRFEGRPLYEWIVLQARQHDLAGATVVRGVMGYGMNSRIQTDKVLRLSDDLPVVIELVDSREKLEAFLPEVDRCVKEGLVTMEKAEVRIYRSHPKE